MTMTTIVRTTLRLSWVIAILLLIACAAPTQSKDEVVYRGVVSDSEYYAMQMKEREARQKEAEMRKYVDLIQERSDLQNRIIFGLFSFLASLILAGLGLLFTSIKSLNRTTTLLVQQNKDQKEFCKLRHEPIDSFITNHNTLRK